MPDVTEDSTTLAVLATKLDHLTGTVGDIKKSLETSTTVHVTRSEWELRNQTVDERFANVWGEFKRQEARRAPWWVMLGAIGGVVATIALLLQWVPNIVN